MPQGRPRAFDVDEALESALKVFWERGYEGASLPELTEAMGINRPSMYAAFGNKEELFRKALTRYVERSACYIEKAVAEPTARAVIEKLMYGAVEVQTGANDPKGCLMVQGALACGESAACIRDEIAAKRKEGETVIRKRFERARAEGDLAAEVKPADLARFVTTQIFGMAVHAAGGATRAELKRVVDVALRAIPG